MGYHSRRPARYHIYQRHRVNKYIKTVIFVQKIQWVEYCNMITVHGVRAYRTFAPQFAEKQLLQYFTYAPGFDNGNDYYHWR